MLHFTKNRITFCGLWIVMAACSSSAPEDDDDGSSDATSGGGETCPSEVAHNGACTKGQLGVTCPGRASCLCGSEIITADASCVCQEGGALGQAWHCGDDCAQACGTGGAGGTSGVGGSPPTPLTCVDFCAHMNAYCPDAFPNCEGLCEVTFMQPGCESQVQAYFQCFIGKPLVCEPYPYAEGCESENSALQACQN